MNLAAHFAFYTGLAATVPPPFCDHGGAKCSHHKHALVVNGVEGEPAELSFLRALVMTVQTSGIENDDGWTHDEVNVIWCRCCGEWLA